MNDTCTISGAGIHVRYRSRLLGKPAQHEDGAERIHSRGEAFERPHHSISGTWIDIIHLLIEKANEKL